MPPQGMASQRVQTLSQKQTLQGWMDIKSSKTIPDVLNRNIQLHGRTPMANSLLAFHIIGVCLSNCTALKYLQTHGS